MWCINQIGDHPKESRWPFWLRPGHCLTSGALRKVPAIVGFRRPRSGAGPESRALELISDVFPLAEAPAACEKIVSSPADTLAVVLTMRDA